MGELCTKAGAAARKRLGSIEGCKVRFEGPSFKEFVLETPMEGSRLARGLARRGYLVGPPLGRWYPELENCLLVATTERRTIDDVNGLGEAIEKELAEL